ncbi:hypothetical protein ASC97_31335 [Rhizobium sp. Root1203]|uniref:methyl-accepting chemotaxis protein n=1 Tax=Rhizobium sp. Root1203 TaxID=1736427 RepID=UPI00070B58FB|nr:methyl-accepting chemotaxis protein [Rhizobium sp. Root1203]KQV15295.1 hypothetical protein ASC97_31335 [Rhizobium sp. Root1203]
MRRPSIKITLISMLLVVGCSVAGSSLTTLKGTRDLYGATQTLTNTWVPGLRTASRLQTDFMMLRLAISRAILASKAAGLLGQDGIMKKAVSNVAAGIQTYRALPVTGEERALLAEVDLQFGRYATATQEVMQKVKLGKRDEATDIFNRVLTPQGAQMMDKLQALVETNLKGTAEAGTEAGRVYDLVQTIALGIGLLIFSIIIAAAIFAVRGIANPILSITRSMGMLAGGNTAVAVGYATRTDEIGKMAAAVEIFRNSAIRNRELEKNTETQRQQAESDRRLTQERAEAEADDRLRTATSGLAAGLARLASGDLDFQLTEAFAPEFEALRRDFNTSVHQLGDTLQRVSGSIGSIESGSHEMSDGAMELSRRTEKQAAAIEEAAAALEEITINVVSSSQRTEKARLQASQANEAARTSATVVADAVDAMHRIERSSSQITNIIAVIDEIAFQTNLLALNAGVEAARAGDAGKGFAVVAQEVRELAQRAASAAKEIKGLIRSSTAEVGSGVRLVSETGKALNVIETFVADVNIHLDAIATAAKEQSDGLLAVSQAVNQLDQATQQNAAMVEESTAAAGRLASEAEALKVLVSHFRLAGDVSPVGLRMAC